MSHVVSSFFSSMEKRFGPSQQLNKVLAIPLVGQTRTILQGVENFAERGQNIPAAAEEKIAKSVQGRLAVMKKAQNFEEKLVQICGRDTSEKILFKKNCQWIPGQEMELAKVQQHAIFGAVDEESFDTIFDQVLKVAQAKSVLDRAVGKVESDAIFFQTPFDIKNNPAERFLDAAMAATKAKKQGIDPLEGYDEDFFPLELDSEESDVEDDSDDFSSGSDTLSTCDLFYAEETLELDDDAFDEKKLAMQKAALDFREEYQEDITRFVLSKMEGTDFSLESLQQEAEKVIDRYQEMQQSLLEWMAQCGFSKEEGDYALYAKRIWPGYEEKGEFSLLDPLKPNQGPLFTIDFNITDAICEQLASSAAEVRQILDVNIKTIKSIADELELDAQQLVRATYFWDFHRMQMHPKEAYILPKHLSNEDLCWIRQMMHTIKAAG